ncbi:MULTISPECIES: hypothetical protein [Methylocaldum]|jgi:hypothetical protein|uniref:hypothetical protein n=1 Tax=unclassified Methylocaldum TaxID=2622260 RepID=UPI001061B65A
MNVRLTFAALAALIGFCGTAQAEIFAGGPAYGGPGSVGGNISCRIFNYGLSPVTITQRQIFTNTNETVAPSSDTCDAELQPATYCAFVAPIQGNLAYSCWLTATGTDTRLSGVAEIQASDFSVLNAVPIQK